MDAVNTLIDGRAAPPTLSSQPVKPKIKKPFALPKANRCGFHSIAYLQGRGIDSEIISRCINNGSFYESAQYHNCVFVGYDLEKTPRFAWLRGITSGFRMDIESSDKRYNFILPSTDPTSRIVTVSESPIDALSLASLLKMATDTWDRCDYLSLGGTSPLALMQYLKDRPHVENVYLCLDNDKAGMDAMLKIVREINDNEALSGRSITVTIEPPPTGKDYNDALLAKLRERKENTVPRRLEAAISI